MFTIQGRFNNGVVFEDKAGCLEDLIWCMDQIHNNQTTSIYTIYEDGINKAPWEVLADHTTEAEEIIKDSKDPEETENHIVSLFDYNPWS